MIYNATAKEVFVYSNTNWVKETKRCDVLKKTIRVVLSRFISNRIKRLETEEIGYSEDAMKKKSEKNAMYNKIRLQLTKKRVVDDVVDLIKQDLAYKQGKEIVFDTCPEQIYNLHFKNGVYELNNRLFRERYKSDHITKYLDWSFNPERDEGLIAKVKNEFIKIQPDEQQLKFCLGWLAYTLDGDTGARKCKFNIGYEGRNGKSTEMKIHSKVFDMYSMKLDSSVFDLGNTKRHKQFIHLIQNPIRFAYVEELSRKNLDVETLKDFIDGDKLNVEIMFGTSSTKNIQAKLITCSNKDFNISGSDKAMGDRGTVQYYNSRFKLEGEPIDSSKHQYMVVENYQDTFNSEAYKNAYFHLLLEHYDRKKAFIPKENVELFQDVVDEYDVFTNNFEQVFELTDDSEDLVHKEEALVAFNEVSGKSQYGWKMFLSEMKRKGVKYDRNKKSKGQRGFFMGLRYLPEDPESDQTDPTQSALDCLIKN